MAMPVRSDDGARTTVLVVDDEPIVLHAATRALRAAGYDVTTCTDGAEAMALIATRPFAVVVSDIEMPHMTGLDLVKTLREQHDDVPVILMTGSPIAASAADEAEHRAFECVMKPVENQQLRAVVARAAGSRRRAT